MLKRRSRIQKYISILKKKHIKKNSLQNHTVLKHKLQHVGERLKVQQEQPIRIEIQQQRQQACWNDPDDPTEQDTININQKNKFRKLTNFGMSLTPSVEQYQRKLGKFYESRHKRFNWAQEAEDIEQKDLNDYLNQQIYFSDKKQTAKNINFFAKTSQKHESIVSGLDWHKNVMFSTGLDHKLKVWHFQPGQINPQLKLKLEKDIYIEDLPLSNCFYRQKGLLIGTLRKNLVQVDIQKWKPVFITSSFLKDHKTYQNLRISTLNGISSIFSQNKISLLDKNNQFVGSLLANQTVEDVCFGKSSANSIYAVSADSIYEWDSRKFGIVRVEKKYLGFTTLSVSNSSINVGSKLGTAYIYNINDFKDPIQNNNLVTHITQVKTSKNGEYSLILSKWKANAIRVLDSISGKAIGNWPGVKTKVGLPMQASFNDFNYFGVGSSHGFVSVYGFNNQII